MYLKVSPVTACRWMLGLRHTEWKGRPSSTPPPALSKVTQF